MAKKFKADFALLTVTLVWGASFTLMKQALEYMPPFTFLAYRYLLAAIFLIIIFNKYIKKIDKSILKYGALIGVTLFAGCTFQIIGLKITTASKSGFITGLNVVFVPLFIAIKYKKLPNIYTSIGIIISVIGLALLSINGPLGINLGDILTLLCAIFFAMEILFISKYTLSLDPICLTIVTMLTVSILSLLPGILLENLDAVFNSTSVFALIFTSLFCSAFAYLVQIVAQKYTSPTHTALILLAEPIFSALFAYILLGETMNSRGIIGCILMFLGMVLSEF